MDIVDDAILLANNFSPRKTLARSLWRVKTKFRHAERWVIAAKGSLTGL